MGHQKEHLARMNRSGQRGGAVGKKPTVCTRLVLDWIEEGILRGDEKVCDFGAGKKAAQTAILRDAGLRDVTPYDIGANDHGTTFRDIEGSDVVVLSNVLNVQDSMESVETLLGAIFRLMAPGGLLVCNLPREPRYGYVTPHLVVGAALKAGFEVEWQEKYGSGTLWNFAKPRSN